MTFLCFVVRYPQRAHSGQPPQKHFIKVPFEHRSQHGIVPFFLCCTDNNVNNFRAPPLVTPEAFIIAIVVSGPTLVMMLLIVFMSFSVFFFTRFKAFLQRHFSHSDKCTAFPQHPPSIGPQHRSFKSKKFISEYYLTS